MTTTPTPKPWREAAVDDILTVIREMEDHVDTWINARLYHDDTVGFSKHRLFLEFTAILAKHDPANVWPLEFRPGQVWQSKYGRRTILSYENKRITWRWTPVGGNHLDSTKPYHSTYKGFVGLIMSSQLIAGPNATTPAPTSGRDYTKGTI